MYKVGDIVKQCNEDVHKKKPDFFPPLGTVGRVVFIDGDGDIWVQWPKGSTSDDDVWCVESSVYPIGCVEIVATEDAAAALRKEQTNEQT